MYVSKYYTCEEIDERLLQGYYNDFVDAGFVGSKDEFFRFVLSISNKVDKEDGKGLSTNDFTDELKEKLDSIDEGAKLITKVSQLENDLNYQTAEQVKASIDALINAAPEALDTLKELADALGNDPNFATNIVNRLAALQTALNDEVARATQAEADLGARIDNLDGDLESRVQALNDKIDATKAALEEKIQTVQDKLDAAKEDLANFKVKEAEDIAAAKEQAHNEVDSEKDRAMQAEADLQQNLDTLEQKEVTDISNLQQQLTQESAARSQADQSLTDNLNAEIAARQTAGTTLQQNIDKEVSDRQAAVEALQEQLESDLSSHQTELNSKLDTEIANRRAGDLQIQTDLAVERSERQSEDAIINHKIEDIQSAMSGQQDTLLQKINQEIADRQAADQDLDDRKVDKREGYSLTKNDFTDELKAKLDSISEGANKIEKVSELVNDLNFQTREEVEAAINAIIDSAPDVLNTLREIAAALDDDPNFAATMTRKLTALTEQLNAEIASRQEKDADLQARITQEIADRREADNLIKESLAEEKAARQEADANLRERIDDNKAAQDAINESLTDMISDLRTQQGSGMNELRGLIDTNIANIQRNFEILQVIQESFGDVETLVNEKVAAEKTRAEAKEAELLTQIQSLVTDYTTKINTLSTTLNSALEAEKTTRQDADAELRELIQNSGSSLAEEIAARELADQQLQAQITQETSARQAADTQNTEKITQEIQDRKDADNEIKSSVSTERSERIAADNAEEAARIAGDDALRESITNLNTALLTEKSERQAADTNLQTNINNEKTSRETADSNLQAQIEAQATSLEQEANTRDTADKSLLQKINTEIDERVAEIARLDELIQLKQDALKLGYGLAFDTEGLLNVTIDGTIYKIVGSLPERPATGMEDKIYCVPVASAGAQNVYTEYLWIEDSQSWEIIGTFSPEVDLTPYATIEWVTAELAAKATAIETLTQALADEVVERKAKYNELNDALNTEKANRQEADALLNGKIEQTNTALLLEVQDRKIADQGLKNDITNEAAARTLGDSQLQLNLDSEAEARRVADTALDEKIDEVKQTVEEDQQAAINELKDEITELKEKMETLATDPLTSDEIVEIYREVYDPDYDPDAPEDDEGPLTEDDILDIFEEVYGYRP